MTEKHSQMDERTAAGSFRFFAAKLESKVASDPQATTARDALTAAATLLERPGPSLAAEELQAFLTVLGAGMTEMFGSSPE